MNFSEYCDQITTRLHGDFKGLKETEGLDWLASTLVRLEDTGEPGLKEIVRSFIKQMHRADKAEGFLLEIRVADSLLDSALAGNVLGNTQDGIAQRPCDVTAKFLWMRADVQCKSIRNVSNELPLAEFKAWAERHFSSISPGLDVEIACNTGADEETFAELREFLRPRTGPELCELSSDFFDSDGVGHVQLTFALRGRDGLHFATTWSSANQIGVAQAVNTSSDREIILKRFKKAKTTFGFMPAERQHNFVAISVPSLTFLHPSQLTDVFYGIRSYVIGGGRFEPVLDKSGLFFTENLDYCSGAMLVRFNDLAYDNLIFPHPRFEKDIRRLWSDKKGFRVVSHPHLDGKFDSECRD